MFRKAMLTTFVLTLAAVSSRATAQQSTPAQSADDQRLEALLSEADLFYKKNYFEGSQRWEYKIAWSEKGETSMMAVYLRSIGTRPNGDPIYVVYAWTQVKAIGDGEQLSPAEIKLIASLNDDLLTGNYSTSKYGAFANTGIVFDDITAKALRTTLWDMHYNALRLKKQLADLR